ncbi:MAG: hypothetical protein J0I84_10520 [Terrimonas sp.]|nr:hypothetical protein [Terrimonas sp.]OJY95622.1 MAG: hypothetical protein BGP13_12340 [Sphingobacteriales bacterium 40-81]
MLENLLDLVKQNAGSSIINNPAIPNDRNEEAITETTHSIASGLQGLLSQGGGLKDVLKMFGGQDAATNSISQQLSGGVIQNLMDKFGLDQGSAGSIAGGLIPSVLSNLVGRTNDPNDNGFDIQSIFNSLSGGQTSNMNIAGLLSKVQGGGLDVDGDGDTDLQDLMALFSKGNSGGSILDKVKGLFGN